MRFSLESHYSLRIENGNVWRGTEDIADTSRRTLLEARPL